MLSQSIRIRAGLVGFFFALSGLYLMPTLAGWLPSWWVKALPSQKVNLGLDLQGGMYLLLEVETRKAFERAIEKCINDINDALAQESRKRMQKERSGDGLIRIALPDDVGNELFTKFLSDQCPGLKVTSLDEQEGRFLYTLGMNPKDAKSIGDSAVRQVIEIIRNRIDQFGVSAPVIVSQGENQILVELPGVKNPQRAIELIGQTALLEFKLVDDENNIEDALKGTIPPDDEVLYQKVLENGILKNHPFLLKKRVWMTGEVLTDARFRIKPYFDEPYVAVNFNRLGARVFDQMTGENVGKRMAIVLDNNIYSILAIEERIIGGKANIAGSLTIEKAADLAVVLRAGTLPAPVRIIQNVTVGPTLGQDSVEKGIRSAIIGFFLVVVFMTVYYRLCGLIANWALVLNIVYLLGALVPLQAPLTLPGIAGIILAIGMAVDSNILVFERIREELRLGKTVKAAVNSGYDKSLFTIIDSHMTTLIAAAVLFQLGTGPIKGFAVTLSLGVIINLFSSLVGTKVIFDWINMRWQLKTLSI